MNLYTLITYFIYGSCAICFLLIINSFVSLVWGDEYLLSKVALYLIVLNFMFHGFQAAINVFRDTTGLFVQGKYRGLISAAVNVIVSVIFVRYWGIEGVLLGTIVARVFVSAWYDPYVLYKHFFHKSSFRYFKRLVIYIALPFGIAWLMAMLIRCITPWENNLIVSIIGAFVSLPLLVLPFIGTIEYKELKARVKGFIFSKR